MRGRRQIYDIVRTKPEALNSKLGKTGTPVTLTANYFRLLRSPQWNIYQYRVDFAPDIEHMMVRKGLIGSQKENFGGYLFDGTMLFLTRKLPNESTELYSTRRDGEQIRITVKFVGEISMTNGTALQILNLILRRAMEGLKLQLVGRNFFDAVAKININEFKLQLWPGYQTSIRQHEADILLCAEITHKVMRCATVLDIMADCARASRDYRTAFQQQIIGQVVLTDYNNKTYRIDDVDFDTTPDSTFATKDGEISYMDYYLKVSGFFLKFFYYFTLT
jgi:aubergine